MGTHISRVKSVDLDAWTDEQVESMVKWGNEKCNMYWEAKLPSGYIPDSSKIENFIRTKYDMKKWIALPRVPDPMSLHSQNSASTSLAATTNGTADLLSVATEVPSKPQSANSVKPKQSERLLDDDFGSFSSASNAHTYTGTVARKSDQRSPITKSSSEPPTTPVPDQRKDLKKSILSLYSTLSAASSSLSFSNSQNSMLGPHMSSANRSSPGAQFHTTTASTNNMPIANLTSRQSKVDPIASMSDSLLGLNFGTPTPAISTTPSSSIVKPVNPAMSSSSTPLRPQLSLQSRDQIPLRTPVETTSSWNNEWSDIPASDNPWGSSLGINNSSPAIYSNTTSSIPSFDRKNKDLEDDLYKNVWT